MVRRIEDYIKGYNESSLSTVEKADCFVQALALVTESSYDTAHVLADKFFDRKSRCGTDVFKITRNFKKLEKIKLVFEGKNFKCKVLPLSKIQNKKIHLGIKTVTSKTIKTFCKENPNGSIILIVSGHALALRDGILYDDNNFPGLHRRVLAAIEFRTI